MRNLTVLGLGFAAGLVLAVSLDRPEPPRDAYTECLDRAARWLRSPDSKADFARFHEFGITHVSVCDEFRPKPDPVAMQKAIAGTAAYLKANPVP